MLSGCDSPAKTALPNHGVSETGVSFAAPETLDFVRLTLASVDKRCRRSSQCWNFRGQERRRFSIYFDLLQMITKPIGLGTGTACREAIQLNHHNHHRNGHASGPTVFVFFPST